MCAEWTLSFMFCITSAYDLEISCMKAWLWWLLAPELRMRPRAAFYPKNLDAMFGRICGYISGTILNLRTSS